MNNLNVTDNVLYITLRQEDGTSQYVPLLTEQVNNLGLNIIHETKQQPAVEMIVESLEKQPEAVQMILENIQPQIETIQVSADVETNENYNTGVVYKVIKPEDLNLQPVRLKHLPRGRPKKKIIEKPTINQELPSDAKLTIKQCRTRSGRITRPPKHIKADFKKIDITEEACKDEEIKTVEFEPLKTNKEPENKIPLLSLDQHHKKRNIPPRFRCPKCNKAYLGKTKMIQHFEKYPDHGSVPTNYRSKHTSVWEFLIMTAQKYPGRKGAKFCEELVALFQNARTLAKLMFKPVDDGKKGYRVDGDLAFILGIKGGEYEIDETELLKDVAFYEYLESKEKIEIDEMNATCKVEDKMKNEVNMDVQETQADVDMNFISIKNSTNESHMNATQNLQINTTRDNSLALVKYEIPKMFNFNNPPYLNVNNDIVIDNFQNSAKEVKQSDRKEILDLHKHITLQNELHDVEELMLENVDTGHVNILETSSNSDDIMNVDQFVNERFKKLTEPDIDLQTNPLNLELLPLDIFQFHNS